MKFLEKLFRRAATVYQNKPAATEPADGADNSAPYPVIRQPLAPFEPAPDTLGAGWREVAPFGAACHRPLVRIALLAPPDATRANRIAALSVAGLASDVLDRGAALPAVAKVQRLRDDLAAARHRAEQAEGAIAAAKEQLEAAVKLDEIAGPTEYARAVHREAQATAAKRAAVAEVEQLRKQLATATPIADTVLREFARSAAELLHRRRREELLDAIRELPGDVVERLLNLWAAANEIAADAGDGVHGRVRSALLGADLGATPPMIVPDAVDGSVLEFPAEAVLPAIRGQVSETTTVATPDGERVVTRWYDVPAEIEAEPTPEPPEPVADESEDSWFIGEDRDLTEAEAIAEGIFNSAGG